MYSTSTIWHGAALDGDWKATMADMKNEKDLPLRAKAKGGDEFIYNSLFLQLLISLFDVIDFAWTEMTQNVPEI